MNFAIISAGGTGQRMHSAALPKQFLTVHGKPIIVHTIEKFQFCNEIDQIVVVCLDDYIEYMQKLKEQYGLSKIVQIISGGSTGQKSIYNGLCYLENQTISSKDIVLIHDGVRPLINPENISAVINNVIKYGNAITVSKINETVLVLDGCFVENTVDRSKCFSGRAPQGFYLNELLDAHREAIKLSKNNFVDSATLMSYFGKKLYAVEGPPYNIKVTTPSDFYIFKALLDAKESEQITIL